MFEQTRGMKPAAFGGRDAATISRLLARCAGDADVALEAMRAAFADPFWASKVTLDQLAHNPDRFRSLRAAPRNPQRPLQAATPREVVDGWWQEGLARGEAKK